MAANNDCVYLGKTTSLDVYQLLNPADQSTRYLHINSRCSANTAQQHRHKIAFRRLGSTPFVNPELYPQETVPANSRNYSMLPRCRYIHINGERCKYPGCLIWLSPTNLVWVNACGPHFADFRQLNNSRKPHYCLGCHKFHQKMAFDRHPVSRMCRGLTDEQLAAEEQMQSELQQLKKSVKDLTSKRKENARKIDAMTKDMNSMWGQLNEATRQLAHVLPFLQLDGSAGGGSQPGEGFQPGSQGNRTWAEEVAASWSGAAQGHSPVTGGEVQGPGKKKGLYMRGVGLPTKACG